MNNPLQTHALQILCITKNKKWPNAMFSHEWKIIEISKLGSCGINLREE